MADSTTISISDENWRRLNDRKDKGDTFDEVISDLLEQAREEESADSIDDRPSSRVTARALLDELPGTECEYCENGRLRQSEFKSDDAVVCGHCGTPAVRVW